MSILSMRRRAVEKTKGLPDGYLQLDYIDTNTRKFSTGFLPNKFSKVEIVYKGTQLSSTKAGPLFGCRDAYKTNGFYYRTYASNASDTTTRFELGWGNEIFSTETLNIDSSDLHVYGVNGGVFYVDDIVVHTFDTTTTPGYELYINAINNGGSAINISGANGNLYSFKIWDNGEMVRNYIPVKRLNDNVKGLFDLINNQFIVST